MLSFLEKINKLSKVRFENYSILEGNEAQTRWLLIDPFILDVLGFTRSEVITEYSIDKEDRKSKYDKLDYALLIKNRPKILIEAKSLGSDLCVSIEQLSKYFNAIVLKYDYGSICDMVGILTDGDKYLFFKSTETKPFKMCSEPFFTIQFSISEESECSKLFEFQKQILDKKKVLDLISPNNEGDLYTFYRIDEIDSVINFFGSVGIDVEIRHVNLKGRRVTMKNFYALYKRILKEVQVSDPNLLYSLAKKEDELRNGNITSAKLSLNPINSSNIIIETISGKVFVSMSNKISNLIERILYLIDNSNYGRHNLSVSLQEHQIIY